MLPRLKDVGVLTLTLDQAELLRLEFTICGNLVTYASLPVIAMSSREGLYCSLATQAMLHFKAVSDLIEHRYTWQLRVKKQNRVTQLTWLDTVDTWLDTVDTRTLCT